MVDLGTIPACAGSIRADARMPAADRHSLLPPPTGHTAFDAGDVAHQAEQMHTAGQFRAAARQWRRLADHHARLHGNDHPMVFDSRLRAARAHVPLGERDRALRQLTMLLEDRVRADGPEHPAVLDLRREIERLDGGASTPPLIPPSTPDADH